MRELANYRPKVSPVQFILLLKEIIRHEQLEQEGLSHNQALDKAKPILHDFLGKLPKDEEHVLLTYSIEQSPKLVV